MTDAPDDAVSLFDDMVDGLLDDFPVLESPEGTEEVPLLGSLEEAYHVARCLRAVARKRDRLAAAIDPEIARIEEALHLAKAHKATVDAPLGARYDYLEGLLKRFALSERDHGRGKSLVTPYATVSTTERGGGWEVDKDKALAWAKEHRPSLVKTETVETFLLADAKRAGSGLVANGDAVYDSTRDGELVPGLTVKDKTVSVTVSIVDGQP